MLVQGISFSSDQWLFLVPLKGGRWHITPQVYTTYILPSGGFYATYHLLGEPETTIDQNPLKKIPFLSILRLLVFKDLIQGSLECPRGESNNTKTW